MKAQKKRKRKILSIKEIARSIGIPVKKWAGNCHTIAQALLDAGVVKGNLRYGHFLGSVKSNSRFGKRAIIQHGWIEKKNGSIVDPTRWVFENAEPYVYIGLNNGEYDTGGNQFRMDNMRPVPLKAEGEEYKLHLSLEVADFLRVLFRLKGNGSNILLGFNQVFWLSNLAPQMSTPHTKELYQELGRLKLEALVPMDNWHLVMKG